MNDNINDNDDISLNNMRKLKINNSSLKDLEDTAKRISSSNQKKIEKTNDNVDIDEHTLKNKETQIKELGSSSLSEIQNIGYSLKEFGSIFKSSVEKFIEYQSKMDEQVKGKDAISRGNVKINKYLNYYDRHFTIPRATAADPNDFDSSIYNNNSTDSSVGISVGTVEIFRELERYADKVRVINDGPDTLFAVISHGGKTNFSKEEPIYAGQYKDFYYVYEMRFRSPTSGLRYRVMEYETEPGGGIVGSAFQPIEKAVIHNTALPGIGTNFLATDITPTNSPSAFLISVGISVTGNLSVVYTRALNAQTLILNPIAGPALSAASFYLFEITVHSGDSINFVYSATGGTIQILRVMEVDAGTI